MSIEFEKEKKARAKEIEQREQERRHFENEVTRMKKHFVDFLSKRFLTRNFGKAFSWFELQCKLVPMGSGGSQNQVQKSAFHKAVEYFENPNNSEGVKCFYHRGQKFFCIGCSDEQIQSLKEY